MKNYTTILLLFLFLSAQAIAQKVEKRLFYFKTGKSELTDYQSIMLKKYINDMKTTKKVVIFGYADGTGTKEANKKVTVKRVNATARTIITSFPLLMDSVFVYPKGSTNYIADNKTAYGRYLNRRVEVFIYSDINIIKNEVAKVKTPVRKINPSVEKQLSSNVSLLPKTATLPTLISKPVVIEPKSTVSYNAVPFNELLKNVETESVSYTADENTLQKLIEKNVQSFSIKPSRDTFIVGRSGSIHIIPAKTFRVVNKKQNIDIRLYEALTIGDLLRFNLHTQAEKGILSTPGMIKIEASQGDKQLSYFNKNFIISIIPDSTPNTQVVFNQLKSSSNGQSLWSTPKEEKKQINIYYQPFSLGSCLKLNREKVNYSNVITYKTKNAGLRKFAGYALGLPSWPIYSFVNNIMMSGVKTPVSFAMYREQIAKSEKTIRDTLYLKRKTFLKLKMKDDENQTKYLFQESNSHYLTRIEKKLKEHKEEFKAIQKSKRFISKNIDYRVDYCAMIETALHAFYKSECTLCL
jgi:hypothetical protein